MNIKQTECSKTSAYKIQTPGNYPKENIQHTEHSESLKSRIVPSSLNAQYEAVWSLKMSGVTHMT